VCVCADQDRTGEIDAGVQVRLQLVDPSTYLRATIDVGAACIPSFMLFLLRIHSN
jgi:hypothetical protein